MHDALQPARLPENVRPWVEAPFEEYAAFCRDPSQDGRLKGTVGGVRCVRDRLSRLQLTPEQESTSMDAFPALCGNCWIKKAFCMCDQAQWISGKPFPHQLHLFMSHKEFGQGSNSGKILLSTLPENSHLYVSYVSEDEQRLLQVMQENKGRVFVLFPGRDALEASELAEHWREATSKEQGSQSSEDLGAGPLHFIILDSTWPQAYTLRKWLSKKDKSLQEVKVSPSSESQFVVRKRIAQVEGQICTLEAVVLLLEDFGHPEVGPVLLTNLRIMVRNVLRASSKLDSSKGDRLAALELQDPR